MNTSQRLLRVAILDDFQDAWKRTDGVRRMRERADVTIFTKRFGDAAALKSFDVLIANRERTPFDRALLEALDGVKLIVQTGKHNPHIDFDAAKDCGIEIVTASGGYSIGAAELTIALALAVTRRIPMLDAAVRRGEWSPPSTPVLHGKTYWRHRAWPYRSPRGAHRQQFRHAGHRLGS